MPPRPPFAPGRRGGRAGPPGPGGTPKTPPITPPAPGHQRRAVSGRWPPPPPRTRAGGEAQGPPPPPRRAPRRPGRARGGRGGSAESLDQRIDPDRLDHVVVHAGGQARLAVALHRVGGHRDDARALAVRPSRRDAPRRLEAVHLGHLHVHQHHVVGLARDRLDRLDAVRRQVGAVAHLLQQAQRQLLVHDVVFGEQDAQRMARGRAWRRSSAWPPRARPSARRRGRAASPACRRAGSGAAAWRAWRRRGCRPPRAGRAS